MKRKNCKEDYEDDTENECFTDPSENVVSEQSSRSLDLANDDCSSNSDEDGTDPQSELSLLKA